MKKVLLVLVVGVLGGCAATGGTNYAGYSHQKHHRSESAKNDFKRSSPCPSNGNNHGPCPGYVIDHVNPLACGGADASSNMQWQTVADGKAKDKWERVGCR